MITYKDKTFCGSDNCQNKCGKKMTQEEEKKLESLSIRSSSPIMVSYAQFCDSNGELKCHD